MTLFLPPQFAPAKWGELCLLTVRIVDLLRGLGEYAPAVLCPVCLGSGRVSCVLTMLCVASTRAGVQLFRRAGTMANMTYIWPAALPIFDVVSIHAYKLSTAGPKLRKHTC